MDKSTQENAAMVEQTAESTRVLAQESERLAELVAQFRVGAARAWDERRAA
jgi:methyl-accepting chemotaxis protein